MQFLDRPRKPFGGAPPSWGRTKNKADNRKTELGLVRQDCLKKLAKKIHRFASDAVNHRPVVKRGGDAYAGAKAFTAAKRKPGRAGAQRIGRNGAVKKKAPIALRECDTLTPKYVCISYPGSRRQDLFWALKAVNLDLLLDVHAMSKVKVDQVFDPNWVPLDEAEHFQEFVGLEGWSKLKSHISGIDLEEFETEFDPVRALAGKRNKYGLGPHWFVNEWGKAAVNAVTKGWGVIIFERWGGEVSPWCRLERIFATQCLQFKYPGCVYVFK
jgi:hypothetical protein